MKKLQKPRNEQDFECGLEHNVRFISLRTSSGDSLFYPLDENSEIAYVKRISKKILQACEYAELLRKTEKKIEGE